MGKIVRHGTEARDRLVDGINIVANAVGVTLGPGGKLAAVRQKFGPIVMTKDGVSVARSIDLADPTLDAGARLCVQVASRTNELCGDGTTTATVLAQTLVNDGLKYVENGGNSAAVVAGMRIAVEEALSNLDGMKVEISSDDPQSIEFVATVAGNDPVVGSMVAKAYSAVGKDGTVALESSRTSKDSLEISSGYRFDRGVTSAYFCTNMKSMTLDMDDAYVLVWEKRLVNPQEMFMFVKKMKEVGRSNLIIVTDDYSEDVANFLVLNKVNGLINVIPIKAPGFGESKRGLLEDIAVVCGAKLFSEELCTSMDRISTENLGRVKKWLSTMDETTIFPYQESFSAIESHAETLKSRMDSAKLDSERDRLKVRVAKLLGKAATIRVGANTDSELTERLARFEDSVNATRVALNDGIVPGGGLALAKCHLMSKAKARNVDAQAGIDIAKRAMLRPLHLIASNAGFSGDLVVQNVLSKRAKVGFDAARGVYCDMMSAGIIDPVMVTKSALSNALSIASLVIGTGCLVAEDQKEQQ
jgi:chaperonin GroEL